MTEADFIQCAGQLGSLITQMTLMKQNIIACTVESPESFLVDAKKVPQSCKEIAVRKEKSVESQITYLAEIGPQQDKEVKGNHKQTRFFQPGTSLKKALFFVLSARCFLIFQIENGRGRLGQDEK